jgi:hypothetical protein
MAAAAYVRSALMSMQATPPGSGGSLTDLVSTIKGGVQNLSQLITVFQNVFPRTVGSFTLAAGTTTTVTQPAVKANSQVALTPTNATAALTVRTAGLFVSTLTPGASFAVSTQNGTAVGTETFSYSVFNPS